MYELVFALLVKMQIELASHLKKNKDVIIVKKTLYVEQYIKKLEQTKLSKYWTCLSD